MAIAVTAVFAMAILVASLAAAGNAVGIATDKPIYAQGESVIITVTNHDRDPIALSGYWVENEKGECVYSPPTLAYMIVLPPRGSYTYIWEQNNDEGEEVAPGTYMICIDDASTKITIRGDADVYVSTDKPRYASGENVLITIVNKGDGAVLLTGYWVEDSDGIQVYAPPMLMYAQYLSPGESVVYTWDQTGEDGLKVAPGTYTVHIPQDSIQIRINAPQHGHPRAVVKEKSSPSLSP
ncbi:MAG: hypothetical protein AB1665_01870 [Candidatus Thermoplasmatota archaeon]